MVFSLDPADHHPARTRKINNNFTRKCDFNGIKFPIKIRDIHKIEKKNCFSISVFGLNYRKIPNLRFKKYF